MPAGVTRADITVTLDYYMGPSGGTATFTMKASDGEVLRRLNGRLPPAQHLPGAVGYPMYEVVTIDGLTEIIEHRKMEPVFYVTDDPAVISALRRGK